MLIYNFANIVPMSDQEKQKPTSYGNTSKIQDAPHLTPPKKKKCIFAFVEARAVFVSRVN